MAQPLPCITGKEEQHEFDSRHEMTKETLHHTIGGSKYLKKWFLEKGKIARRNFYQT